MDGIRRIPPAEIGAIRTVETAPYSSRRASPWILLASAAAASLRPSRLAVARGFAAGVRCGRPDGSRRPEDVEPARRLDCTPQHGLERGDHLHLGRAAGALAPRRGGIFRGHESPPPLPGRGRQHGTIRAVGTALDVRVRSMRSTSLSPKARSGWPIPRGKACARKPPRCRVVRFFASAKGLQLRSRAGLPRPRRPPCSRPTKWRGTWPGRAGS